MLSAGIILVAVISTVASQSCDTSNGWNELDGNCFRVSRSAPETQVTWQEAREACMSEGGELAVITSQEEQDFIIQLAVDIGLSGNNLWIGMKQDGNSGPFGWVDGTEITFEDWAASEPKVAGLTNCAFTLTEAIPTGAFQRYEYYETTSGILDPDQGHVPSMADGVNTFYFGGGTSFNRDYCQYACTNNERCAAYTWYDYHYNYQWQYQCVGRSDAYNILEYDSYGFSGVRTLGNDDGWWITGNCGLTHAFSCKKPIGSDTPITIPPTSIVDSYCPEGFFESVGNKCFRMYTVTDSTQGIRWEQAVLFCRNQGGVNPDLASISSLEENAHITARIQEYTAGYWIGVHYASAHTKWVWADNSEPSYTNWAPGRPSGNGQCGELWSVSGPPGSWANSDCSIGKGFICQTFKDPDNIIATPPPTPEPFCPDGWFQYWYACYKLDTEPRTWSEAQSYCEGLETNSSLVSIHAEAENAAVFLGIQTFGDFPVWLGLKKANPEDEEYVWSDGWPNYYANFDTNGNSGQECVIMKDNSKWNDTSCSGSYASLCKKTDIDRPIGEAPGEGGCPNGNWIQWGNRCYYFSQESDTFYNAITRCQYLAGTSHTANLVSIENAAESNFVYTTLFSTSYRYAAWIGLRFDQTSSTYVWTDGTDSDYRNWAPGSPGNPLYEPCGEMDESDLGKWSTYDCSTNYYQYFVCESELGPEPTYPPVPTSAPGECPSVEWVKSDTHCYLVRPNSDTHWYAALETCKILTGDRGSLTSILTQEENQFIAYWAQLLTDDDYTKPSVWIGFAKQGLGYPYLWEDGTTVDYTNWAPGEPNDIDGSQNCVRMYANHDDINFLAKWDDYFCSDYYNHGYVCKIEQGSFADLDQKKIDRDYQKLMEKLEEYKRTHPVINRENAEESTQEKAKKEPAEIADPKPAAINDMPGIGNLIKKTIKEEKEANKDLLRHMQNSNFEMDEDMLGIDTILEQKMKNFKMPHFVHQIDFQQAAESDDNKKNDHSDTGKILGSVVGVFVGVLVITGLLVLIVQRKKKVASQADTSDTVYKIDMETTKF